MLTEKIKIYIGETVGRVLKKDAEAFEFFRSDGRTLNMNALLTHITVNYADLFDEKEHEAASFLRTQLPDISLHDSELIALCREMNTRFLTNAVDRKNAKTACTISLKPTKESAPVISYIEAHRLAGRSLSSYFRDMLTSYVSLPQDRREEIVFRESFAALQKAISEKKRVFLTLKNGHIPQVTVSPYAIARAKEEMHLYLLAASDKGASPIRLSRIISVTVLSEDAVFTEAQTAVFRKMQEYGPQFIYREWEGEVAVELTERGEILFKKLYVHRPIPVSVEGRIYRFACSHTQIVQYFVRFGGEARVLYPRKVQNEILAFHQKAVRCLRDANRT